MSYLEFRELVVLSPASPLLLASGSPRRRELLESAGIPLRVATGSFDETMLPNEAPDAYLRRVVLGKIETARALDAATSACALLVADTIVVCDDAVLGKPRDAIESRSMVARLAGRAHDVKTRFWAELAGASKSIATTVTTRVFVRALEADWIDAYVATGEGLDKAGAYAVQGRFAFAIERIEGSYTNVVGLPLCEVVQALDDLGVIEHPRPSR